MCVCVYVVGLCQEREVTLSHLFQNSEESGKEYFEFFLSRPLIGVGQVFYSDNAERRPLIGQVFYSIHMSFVIND